jgi:hypothetical protein
MIEGHRIEIHATPLNPVQYLACCGVFEIVARFDTRATAHWTTNASPAFEIASKINEADALQCVSNAITDWDCWRTVTFGDETVCLDVSFTLNGEVRTVSLDWWYEYLNPDGRIKEKSAWKMYAGQQTAEGITKGMSSVAAGLVMSAQLSTFSQVIGLNCGMTGRFGLDPRSSRNALDAGYSANDLKLKIATYPFAEVLALIGAHHFFPHRTRQSAGIESTRGWIDKGTFQYGLWTATLPIALARAAASCAPVDDESNLVPMQSDRGSRDKYSNLTMATPTTLKRGDR